MSLARTGLGDVILFSSIDWDAVWQGPQEIAVRFARLGSRVLFVENTAARAPRLHDTRRILHRLSRVARGSIRSPELPPIIEVFSPLVAPFPWARWSRPLNRLLFATAVRKLAAKMRDPLIFTFLPTTTVLDAIHACRGTKSILVYYCVSDFRAVADDPVAMARAEDVLVSETDLIFVNGETLRARFAQLHGRVSVYPYGVNLSLFRPDGPLPEPPDLARIPRPRAGYLGGVHEHMDVDLVTRSAEILPQVSFVFVGPLGVDVGRLATLRNVHFVGQRPHASLAAYVAGFDVSLIPYRLTPYTQSVVPTKLFEYLASGIPVVSSPLLEILAMRLPEQVLRVARDPEEFALRIHEATSRRPTEEERRLRRSVAEAHSWDRQFEQMLRDIRSVRELGG